MTAVLGSAVAPSPARPDKIESHAAVDRAVRVVSALLLWAGLLLVTYGGTPTAGSPTCLAGQAD